MSFFWAGGRTSALAPARAPRGTAPSERGPRQVLPDAADSDDVRRSGDGAIDVEFYKARAYAIRRAAQMRFAQALRRRARSRAEADVRIHDAQGDDDDSSDWRYRPGFRSRHDRRPHPLP